MGWVGVYLGRRWIRKEKTDYMRLVRRFFVNFLMFELGFRVVW